MADIELIKSKIDIVDYIGSRIELKRAGSNYRAVCPFHNEKTPSFMVNPVLQIFKCFGCGKGGDVIKFIQEMERVEFYDALKIAAEKAGVELKDINYKKDEKLEKEKKQIIEANTLTAKYYNYILKTHKAGKPGRDYAAKRQIDAKMIEKFLFGYAPAPKDNLKKFLLSKGFKEPDLVKWGLLVPRGNRTVDKFWDRLIQPVFNLKGEIVAFSGRYIGKIKEAPKYLNSPKTPVYEKSQLLYGLFNAKESARKKNFIILVEGNIDVVSSARVGVENIVAPLGTAFTKEQAKLLKKHCDSVYLCFDSDGAGLNAFIHALAILEEIGMEHKVIDVGDYQDSDELICKDPSLWLQLVENPKNTVDYLMEKLSVGLDMGSVNGKTKFRNKIVPVLQMLKDEVEKQHYIKQVAMILEISEASLSDNVNDPKMKMSFEPVAQDEAPAPTLVTRSSIDRKIESYLLSLLVQTNTLKSVGLEADYFLDEECKALFEALSQLKDFSELDSLASKLTPQNRDLLGEIVLFDSSELSNLEDEIEKSFKRVYAKYIKHEILKVRKELALNPENEKLFEKLDNLRKELK